MEQYQPVDGDPFESNVSLQPVFGDPFTAGSVTPESQGQAQGFVNDFAHKASQTWPVRLAQGAYTAAMAPGDYMQGKISDEEAQQQAFNLAGLAMTGGVMSGVERGAGEAVLGSGLVRNAATKLEPVTGDPFTPITAYHASPYDFNQFDMSHIGEGEGAQAYGHGLYFAGNEDTMDQYYKFFASKGSNWDDPHNVAAFWTNHFGGDRDQAIKYLSSPALKGGGQDAIDLLKSGDPINPTTGSNPTRYQVQINADPNHFLDWDKPLSEQHPVVQQGVQNIFNELGIEPDEKFLTSGEFTQKYTKPMTQLLQGTDVGRFVPAEGHFTTGGSDQPAIQNYLQQNYPEKLGPYNDLLNQYKQDTTADMKVNDIYDAIGEKIGEQPGDTLRAAAGRPEQREVELIQRLNQAGIPGIKYLDAGSRNPAINHPILGNNLSQDTVDNAVANAAKSASPSLPASKYDELGTNVTEALKNGDDFDAMERFVRQGDWPSEEKAAWFAALNKGREFTTGAKPNATSNYVVFDHNIINILKKYGIGGLGIGTAAGLKHFQTQPVNNDPYSNQPPVY